MQFRRACAMNPNPYQSPKAEILKAPGSHESRLHLRRRLWALVASVCLIGSFTVVLIGAGHGVGSVGYILVWIWASYWAVPNGFGWSGIILTLAAPFCSRYQVPVSAAGIASISVSGCLFFMETEAETLTLVTSIPLLLLLVIRIFQIWRVHAAKE